VLNALDRLAGGYEAQAATARKDLTIAEGQLRDYLDHSQSFRQALTRKQHRPRREPHMKPGITGRFQISDGLVLVAVIGLVDLTPITPALTIVLVWSTVRNSSGTARSCCPPIGRRRLKWLIPGSGFGACPMKIKSLTLKNFRSFGPNPTIIDLDNLTAFVGSNGCGKSTVLQALARLFGVTGAERILHQGDFHVRRKKPEKPEPIELLIEARIEFPELAGEAEPGDAVAECFRQMVVGEPGATPYCRVRLEGIWKPGNLSEGDIDQDLLWIKTTGDEVKTEHKQKMQSHDRSRIHVHYIPAVRDPLKQIRQAAGSIMHRLFSAVNWSDGIGESVKEASDKLSRSFRAEEGVGIIREALTKHWQALHPLPIYSDVHVRPLGRRFDELLAQVEAVFGPAPEGSEHGVERLSDGLKSLFYLTLIGAIFDIERTTPADVVQTEAGQKKHGISRKELKAPSFTVLAVEEPENHLAPHYLGRIMKLLRDMAGSPSGQVLLSSHSASIMRRVEPEWVRYLRLDPETHETDVRSIKLPPEPEAHKFVRQAVLAYPELYFARVVVLGEGDSEEIVLPRIAECHDVPVDASFVSIVPLGGRHVNHFWRLLDGLEIPYVTLLDLDREREGGGWGRIKYVGEQLIAVGKPKEEVLRIVPTDGKPPFMSNSQLEKMHTWKLSDGSNLQRWAERYEQYGVFFSAPLDLDFLMQQSFPAAYQATAEGARGPEIPEANDPDRDEDIKNAIKAVLKKKGSNGATYTDDEKTAFFWYRYLFLGRGKPTTHILAMGSIADKDLVTDCPAVLQRLVTKLKGLLGTKEAEDAAEAGA
jgi:putative ATP-dependent endonuclease of the OLD family